MNSVKERMECLGKKLAAKYNGNEIRFFNTVEHNPDKSGYHAHFLLWTDSENKSELKQFPENSLRGKSDNQTVNTFIEPFNPDDGFCLIWKI
jgi:hypothetical protein